MKKIQKGKGRVLTDLECASYIVCQDWNMNAHLAVLWNLQSIGTTGIKTLSQEMSLAFGSKVDVVGT